MNEPRLIKPLRWAWLALMAVLLAAGSLYAHAADDFLPPEQAFRFAAKALDDRTVEVSFTVAPGYYMYREQMKFEARDAALGTPVLPAGKIKFDETFQKDVESYRGTVRMAVPVESAGGPFRLLVTSQGCADQGLCYPPMLSGADVHLVAFGGDGGVRLVSAAELDAGLGGVSAASGSPQEAGLAAALSSGRWLAVVGVFFVAGLLLSLTPCVLPMLPILSSIIVGGGGSVSRGRGLALAASYSLGMALVYTALGVAAGLAGEGLAAALQNPWVLGAFALALMLLALSMFGAYELQLPAAWSARLTQTSQRLPGGRATGVFAMGGVSALIVSPCVAAPLAGALLYLSQTRDVWLGGSALFALAAGMSVPLLLLGASAGAILPKAGPWMEAIKRFFGLLLVGVAIWMIQPVVPAALALALWGTLCLLAALLLLRAAAGPSTGRWRLPRQTVAAVLGVIGLLQWVGAASGGNDPLQPLAHLRQGGGESATLPFARVRSVAELDAALQSAGRPVMLDFYADWCVSCKEMERYTFSDENVQRRLAGALLLKADVTANNADDRALLRRFQLFGPPGTLFFDAQGTEIPGVRVVGFQNVERFSQTLQRAGL